jgi:hypothetical protein
MYAKATEAAGLLANKLLDMLPHHDFTDSSIG